MDETTESQKAWAEILAKAWADEEYKARFISDPKAVLIEEGLTLKEGMEYKLVENASSQSWLILPAPPKPDQYPESEDVWPPQSSYGGALDAGFQATQGLTHRSAPAKPVSIRPFDNALCGQAPFPCVLCG